MPHDSLLLETARSDADAICVGDDCRRFTFDADPDALARAFGGSTAMMATMLTLARHLIQGAVRGATFRWIAPFTGLA